MADEPSQVQPQNQPQSQQQSQMPEDIDQLLPPAPQPTSATPAQSQAQAQVQAQPEQQQAAQPQPAPEQAAQAQPQPAPAAPEQASQASAQPQTPPITPPPAQPGPTAQPLALPAQPQAPTVTYTEIGPYDDTAKLKLYKGSDGQVYIGASAADVKLYIQSLQQTQPVQPAATPVQPPKPKTLDEKVREADPKSKKHIFRRTFFTRNYEGDTYYSPDDKQPYFLPNPGTMIQVMVKEVTDTLESRVQQPQQAATPQAPAQPQLPTGPYENPTVKYAGGWGNAYEISEAGKAPITIKVITDKNGSYTFTKGKKEIKYNIIDAKTKKPVEIKNRAELEQDYAKRII